MNPVISDIKQFKWETLPEPKFSSTRKNVDGVRMYVSSDGEFAAPSVTTVLGCRGKKAIYEWRKRVGDKAANEISKKASTGGTRLHSLCETYLSGQDIESAIKKTMPESALRFKNYKKFLDTIESVYLLEAGLLSKRIRMGGTVDCIAKIDGKIWVVDFKTSRRMKSKEDIPGYFAQATAYAIMFHEMYGIKVDGIKIAISVEGVDEPVVYDSTPAQHLEYLVESIFMYENGMID